MKLNKATKKLAGENITKGSLQITLEIKKMAEAANLLKSIRDKEEEKESLVENFLEQIEEALDATEIQEILSTQKFDAISVQQEQEQENVPQRPKLSYNIFDGTQNNWSTFRKKSGADL